MYDPRSLKADEFISDEEVLKTIEYAEQNRTNTELIGKILTYGQFLEVVSPLDLRNKVENIIKETLRLY